MVEAHWNSCALLSWSRVKKSLGGGEEVGGAQNETNLHIFKMKFLKRIKDKIQNISNRFWILQLRLVMYYSMHYFPKTFNISWVVRVHASFLRATAGWHPSPVHHRTTQTKRQSVTVTVNWKLPTNLVDVFLRQHPKRTHTVTWRTCGSSQLGLKHVAFLLRGHS